MSKAADRIAAKLGQIAGEPFKPIVLLVLGRDVLGRPTDCRLVHDEQTVTLQGGEEFIVAFARAKVVARRSS